MNRTRSSVVVAVALAALLVAPTFAAAQSPPSLGSAQSFVVLGGSTVTNTGSTIATGDLGVSPGSAVTGFPPGSVVSGTIHAADATADAAQTSLTAAFNDLASRACTQDLTGQDLGGKTLTPGVYCFSTSAQLTGTLTLNAQGNASALFIFKIGSTLTTASGSSVVVINAGSLCNIFWQVGSSATLGTTTSFAGNILAQASITLNTGASVTGRTLARTGAVTLDSNSVTAACTSGTPPATCPPIALAPPTLPVGTIGVLYSQMISASGGAAPYTFDLSAGVLPTGMTLTAAGLLSGTTATASGSSPTVRGTDTNGCFGTLPYTLSMTCPVISLLPATLPNGVVGSAYNQTLTASGGTAPYTYAVTVGTLPVGMTLSSAGVLSGTPTGAGTSTVTIRATDANGCFAALAYTLLQQCPSITLTPATLPNATVGVAFSQTIVGSGGVSPYVFSVFSGALPAGMTLTASGLVAGTPTTAGNTNVTIRGTDANGCFQALSNTMITVSPVPTLPEWGAMLLAAILLSLGYLGLRRRHAGTVHPA